MRPKPPKVGCGWGIENALKNMSKKVRILVPPGTPKSVNQELQKRCLFPEGSPKGPRGALETILEPFWMFFWLFFVCVCLPCVYYSFCLKICSFPMCLLRFHWADCYGFQSLHFPCISAELAWEMIKQRGNRDSGERSRCRGRDRAKKWKRIESKRKRRDSGRSDRETARKAAR